MSEPQMPHITEEMLRAPTPDPLQEMQAAHWQAFCRQQHAEAERLFGPRVAWLLWPWTHERPADE